jgi:hypothetical protein
MLSEGRSKMSEDLVTAVKRLEETHQAIQFDITNMNSRVVNVERDQLVINDVVRRMQLDFLTINEWLNKLTADRNQQNSST